MTSEERIKKLTRAKVLVKEVIRDIESLKCYTREEALARDKLSEIRASLNLVGGLLGLDPDRGAQSTSFLPLDDES